jgi:hypothetical protein
MFDKIIVSAEFSDDSISQRSLKLSKKAANILIDALNRQYLSVDTDQEFNDTLMAKLEAKNNSNEPEVVLPNIPIEELLIARMAIGQYHRDVSSLGPREHPNLYMRIIISERIAVVLDNEINALPLIESVRELISS